LRSITVFLTIFLTRLRDSVLQIPCNSDFGANVSKRKFQPKLSRMNGTCNSAIRDGETPILRVRLGLDLVQISRVADSIAHFGDRFKHRLFTREELAYAHGKEGGNSPCAERLAARFAAKEATIKALNLGEDGVSWKNIEVRKLRGGACELALHGPVAEIARTMGLAGMSLSLSHDGDYAGAVVAMTFQPPDASLFEQRFTDVQ
jgi:holo-[acyl-carrier protein] synthase